MRMRLMVLFLAVSLLGLGACSAVQNGGHDVVNGVSGAVVGQVEGVANLGNEVLDKPLHHGTWWHVATYPLKAGKALLDSVLDTLGNAVKHLPGH